jgi:hypothetical protein
LSSQRNSSTGSGSGSRTPTPPLSDTSSSTAGLLKRSPTPPSSSSSSSVAPAAHNNAKRALLHTPVIIHHTPVLHSTPASGTKTKASMGSRKSSEESSMVDLDSHHDSSESSPGHSNAHAQHHDHHEKHITKSSSKEERLWHLASLTPESHDSRHSGAHGHVGKAHSSQSTPKHHHGTGSKHGSESN